MRTQDRKCIERYENEIIVLQARKKLRKAEIADIDRKILKLRMWNREIKGREE